MTIVAIFTAAHLVRLCFCSFLLQIVLQFVATDLVTLENDDIHVVLRLGLVVENNNNNNNQTEEEFIDDYCRLRVSDVIQANLAVVGAALLCSLLAWWYAPRPGCCWCWKTSWTMRTTLLLLVATATSHFVTLLYWSNKCIADHQPLPPVTWQLHFQSIFYTCLVLSGLEVVISYNCCLCIVFGPWLVRHEDDYYLDDYSDDSFGDDSDQEDAISLVGEA